jgi:predicted nucleic acid-binding protein
MSGNSLLLDTNIILYYLNGDETLIPLVEENHLYVSVINEIELLGYSGFHKKELEAVKTFLSYCTSENITNEVKEKAINLRRNGGLKLPDAIILATALSKKIPFVTADKAFKKIKEGQIIYYDYE